MIPGLGRSPGEELGYPLKYSGLENSMVHGVTKSRTQLSDFHFHLQVVSKLGSLLWYLGSWKGKVQGFQGVFTYLHIQFVVSL